MRRLSRGSIIGIGIRTTVTVIITGIGRGITVARGEQGKGDYPQKKDKGRWPHPRLFPGFHENAFH
ncbi:MAG TPA: hypothetical protein VKA08_14700 [Balneolales bacterium]|nr:hypothetical protein [Balneolales bacterium]